MIYEFSRQYESKLAKDRKLNFNELAKFNTWLDEKHEVLSVKVDYSKLLFENAYDKYEEYYFLEYLDSPDGEIDDEEAEQEGEVVETKEPQLQKVEIKKSTKEVENLVTTFDEVAFWPDAMDEKVGKFAETENLKTDALKNLINGYLFSDKEPLRDEVAKAMNEKPSLKDRAKIADKLTGKIIALVNYLRSKGEL